MIHVPFPLLSFETTPILNFDLRKFTDPLGVKVDKKNDVQETHYPS